MGHCIEDGLKCMCSETGTKKRLEWEGGRKEKSARGDEKDVRWSVAQDRPSRSGNVMVWHNRQALSAAKTRSRCLFCPSPRSYYHLPVHPHQTEYLQRMDCVAMKRSSVGQPQRHRKKTGLLVQAAPLRFGRPRPSYQYTLSNDPVAVARRALPCPADGPTSRMEMRGVVAVAAAAAAVVEVAAVAVAVPVVVVAVTGTGSHLQAVAGRQQ